MPAARLVTRPCRWWADGFACAGWVTNFCAIRQKVYRSQAFIWFNGEPIPTHTPPPVLAVLAVMAGFSTAVRAAHPCPKRERDVPTCQLSRGMEVRYNLLDDADLKDAAA